MTLNECGADLGKSTQVSIRGEVYLRTTQNQSIEVFNLSGRLIEVRRDGRILTIEYNSQNQILRLRIDRGLFLEVEYYLDSGLVKSMTQSLTGEQRPTTFQYLYSGSDLSEVRRADQTSPLTYNYDLLHNLVEIHNENKTRELIIYDDNRDWVTQIRDKNNCTEHFKYIQSASHPALQYVSTVEKTCDNKIVYQANYEFTHRLKSDGTTYLDKVKISFGKRTTKITYHPVLGHPTKITQSRGGHP